MSPRLQLVSWTLVRWLAAIAVSLLGIYGTSRYGAGWLLAGYVLTVALGIVVWSALRRFR